MSRFSFLAVAAAIVLLGWSTSAHASIIFDDFNTNEGHFTSSPGNNGSGTSSIASTSTADRVTLNALEGAGAEEVVGVFSTANPERMRFLSGAGGLPANNTVFSVTAGTDGFIGLYAKSTNATSAKLQLALDESTNTTTSMVGSRPITLITDGDWHLYEWNLDQATDWASLSGVTSNTVLTNGTHTIDSIFMTNILSGFTIDFDFVALNDTGSVAALLAPEPASLGLFTLAFVGFVARGSRRSRPSGSIKRATSLAGSNGGALRSPPPA